MASSSSPPADYPSPQRIDNHLSFRTNSGALISIPSLKNTGKRKMPPKALKLAPFVYKSEPNTPIYATNKLPETAPDEWYVPISHKEKLAVLTMEAIPQVLEDVNSNHNVVTADNAFSPRLMPLLDRMKFYFARSMAMGRHESENGVFEWPDSPKKKTIKENPILPEDVMCSTQIEAFMAGIEEIRVPDENNRLVYRRYWRITKEPAGLKHADGGVISSGSELKHHLVHGVKQTVAEQWNETPKVLIAEFEVEANGFTKAGKMVEEE